jgi:putative membrane protein
MLALRSWTLTALLLVARGALAQVGPEEAHVLASLHHSNQTQIDAGGLALSRAHARKVKQYGEQLIKDHQQADGILRSYARRAGVEIPEPPVARSEAEQQEAQREAAAMRRLRELDGAKFDQAFLNCMVNGNQNDLQMVRAARSQIGDPQLRSMLNNLLPVLQQHLVLAQKLRREVAGSKER